MGLRGEMPTFEPWRGLWELEDKYLVQLGPTVRSGVTASLILNISTTERRAVSLHCWLSANPHRYPLSGPKGGMGAEHFTTLFCPCLDLNPDSSVVQPSKT